VALANKAAVDKGTIAGHSATRGVADENEVEDSPRKGVAEGDMDRHIRSAFCHSDILVRREVCYACLASWSVVAVTARALEFTSSDLLVRQPEGNSQ